jgi:hypothetical protein
MNKQKGLKIITSVFTMAAIVVGLTGQASAAEETQALTYSPEYTYGYGGGPDCTKSVVPPRGGFRVKINNDQYYTFNRQVTLTMKGGSAAYMEVSNYSNFWGSSIVKYATTSQFWLTYGQGQKTVYVKFFNACKQKPTGTVAAEIYSYAWW